VTRLLLVSHSANIGGTEVCFDRALRSLAADARYEILAAYPDGVLASEWERLAPRIPFEGSLPPTFSLKSYMGWLARGLLYRGRLRQVIRKERPDAVVVFSATATSVVRAASREGVPCVCYVREFVRPLWVQAALWRFLARRCATIIAVSGALATALAESASAPPAAGASIRVVRDGVPVPDTWGTDHTAGPPLVACYAGYNPSKGAEVFVRAAARVHAAQEWKSEAAETVRFVLYGAPTGVQGGYRDRLHELVESLDLSAVFSFEESTDFAPTYSLSWIVVVPSLLEGLGLVALEAMASGVPVVASDTGGLADVVQESTGNLFPPGDDEALSRCVLALLDDVEGLVSRGERARERVRQEFSVERSVMGLERVLDEIVASRAAIH